MIQGNQVNIQVILLILLKNQVIERVHLNGLRGGNQVIQRNQVNIQVILLILLKNHIIKRI